MLAAGHWQSRSRSARSTPPAEGLAHHEAVHVELLQKGIHQRPKLPLIYLAIPALQFSTTVIGDDELASVTVKIRNFLPSALGT